MDRTSRSRAAAVAAAADKTGRIIETICGAWCVTCFAAMTGVAILGVFFRYVMQSPFMWTEEVARYLLVWLGFTAVSMALRRDRHIKVEILDSIAPAVAVKILGYVRDILVGLFFVILLRQGYDMTRNNLMTAATIPVSMSWILAAVPAGAALALVQLFLNLVKKIAGEFIPGHPAHPGGQAEKGAP